MRTKTWFILVTAALILISVSSGFAAEGTLADRNSTRIDRLERVIDALDQRIKHLESEKTIRPSPGKPDIDPLLGSWQCTNSIQTRSLTFLSNGQVVIEETTLGSISKATWTRLDAERISIAGSIQYEIRFNSADEFELTEVNRRSTGICKRS